MDLIIENLEEALRYDIIWCWQGGFGSVRLINDLKERRFEGKIIVGFSDNTSLMTLFLKNGGKAVQFAGAEDIAYSSRTEFASSLLTLKKLFTGEEIQIKLKSKNVLSKVRFFSLYAGNLTCYLMTVPFLGWVDTEYEASFFEDTFNEYTKAKFIGDYTYYYYCLYLLYLSAFQRKLLILGQMKGIPSKVISLSLREYYKGKYIWGIMWGHNESFQIVPCFKKGEGEGYTFKNGLILNVKWR